jgi:hypothetical protein
MLSVPSRNAVAFAIASFVALNFACLPSPAQNPVAVIAARAITSTSDGDTLADPVEKELLDLGHFGESTQNVRAEMLGLLSEESSCSAWFRAAEPEAAAKFRSLRYVVDSADPGEILKIQESPGSVVTIQPYVARTGQDVGPGSTITLNAHGAFFQELARVRTRHSANDVTFENRYRPLVVGNFPGGSPAARLLTLLHEFGHVIDILPIDAGVPDGPMLSVRNTETVLRHCGSQIRAHAKNIHKSRGSQTLIAVRPSAPGAETLWRADSAQKWERPFLGGRARDPHLGWLGF